MDRNAEAFNQDVVKNNGYLYTTNARLSSRLANGRLTKSALEVADFNGKKVLDIGCGDGTYTIELFEAAQPISIEGIDAAQEAIDVAKEKNANRRINFTVASAYELPYENQSFDIVQLRGVLHHLDRPIEALKEALRVADTLIIIEPNGYSPVLKLIERFSPYHIEHKEKSYAPRNLDRWVKSLGAVLVKHQWVGLVPCFCPDWMAQILKKIEPVFESVPLVNSISCAVYVLVAQRKKVKGFSS